jgi:hypothetical protein
MKRKREDEDTIEENTSKRPRAEWVEYENSNDSSEVEDDDIDENEGYKALINESVDSTETIWDVKYNKYLEKGMDEGFCKSCILSSTTPQSSQESIISHLCSPELSSKE